MNYNYKFEEAYKSLNERQKEAVDSIEGPVMVVAGPGTGKTQVLTLRIANILKNTDTEPDSILALTFTESATSNMRNRLASLIGPSAYYININTFHGFCGEIIQNFPEYFPHIIGSVNIDKIKQIEIIQNILNGFDYKYIRPLGNPYFYTKELIWQISN
ncbi:MAG: DNA helicase UvrD, partial [Candidatus Liptonbacteria bacterium CG11_big_fil_rev_8_21_14_0_20_35_14]